MVVTRRTVYLCLLGGASASLVLFSVLGNAELLPAALGRFRRYFNLAHENNLAAWWSGSLLLVAALHALDGRATATRLGDRATAAAWAALALVLTALSLDEIGSLHERAEQFVPLKSWWSLLPFAIVLVGIAGWSAWQLWKRHRPRADVVLIAVAFACFGSVAFQEELEHALDWPAWALPLRLGVEEGSELIGMLLLIAATSAASGGVFARAAANTSAPVFSAVRPLASWPLAALPILAVPVFAAVTARLTDVNRGHPADWLAATLFLLAALAAWSGWLEGKRFSSREFAAGGVCLCASAAAVQVGSSETTLVGTLLVNDRLAALACLVAVLAAIGVRSTGGPGRLAPARGLLAVAAVVVAGLAVANPGRLAVYTASGYAAAFAVFSFARSPVAARSSAQAPLEKAA